MKIPALNIATKRKIQQISGSNIANTKNDLTTKYRKYRAQKEKYRLKHCKYKTLFDNKKKNIENIGLKHCKYETLPDTDSLRWFQE